MEHLDDLTLPTDTRTAVIGLGQMGRGIARNLDSHGLLVAANDLNKSAFLKAEFTDKVQNLEIEKLLAEASVVIFAVPSTEQIAQVLGTHQGADGQVIVDLTTSHPDQSRKLEANLAGRGFWYIDSAMTGGATGADAGSLTLMVGGADQIVDWLRPVLETFSSKIFHLGPAGFGHAMKLVHNLILHSSFLATCEGLRLADHAGIDVQQAVDVLNSGNARSFVTETRFPRDILSGGMMARSQISNLEKDLGLAQQFARQLEAKSPYAAMTHNILAKALEAGHADVDFSHLFPLYDSLVDQLENDP